MKRLGYNITRKSSPAIKVWTTLRPFSHQHQQSTALTSVKHCPKRFLRIILNPKFMKFGLKAQEYKKLIKI